MKHKLILEDETGLKEMKRMEGKEISFIQQILIQWLSKLVTVLGSLANSLNKPDKNPCPQGIYSPAREDRQ